MNYEALFSRAGDTVVRVGLVGVGDFGVSLLAQSRAIPNLEIAVLCDRDVHRMAAAVADCGLAADDIVMTEDITEQGLPEFDVLVEATGHLEAAAGLPTRTVPDFCEMGVVANATGLRPDRPDFHAPLLRPLEVADVLLTDAGHIDVFNCFRRADEASFAGGVFVIVQCDDKKTWALLKEKGHVVSGDTRTAMLYNPQHLLGVEAPVSIFSAGLLGLPTGATAPKPVVDLVARTSRDFRKGEVLAITDAHHHEIGDLSPELIAAQPLADGNPCPYYLAVDRRLVVDVPAGTVITAGMLDLDPDQPLHRLRRRQDQHFLS